MRNLVKLLSLAVLLALSLSSAFAASACLPVISTATIVNATPPTATPITTQTPVGR